MNDLPDYQAVTQIQQQVWSEGDFSVIANLVFNASESLVEALRILPTERVLDVACGSGNGAISAARRSPGNVIGLDYVPALLERGRERAASERVGAEFVEGDAQALPFEDDSFDVAISIFGAMFAPDQHKTAAELLRVVKPGGRIGMGNWCPEGGVGRMFRTISQHAPPPPGIDSPLLWGTEGRLRELFGDGISDLRIERRVARQAFATPDDQITLFRTYFGPTKTAFERVGPEGEQALYDDLKAFLEEENRSDDVLVIEPEYLQVIATVAPG